jgi:hypothetical protein
MGDPFSLTFDPQLNQSGITQIMIFVGKSIGRHHTGYNLYRMNISNARQTFLISDLKIYL